MSNTAETLPKWDLSDLYPGMDSDALKTDIDGSKTAAEAFKTKYQGKLAGLSGNALGEAIAEYERISETLGKIGSYAYLVYAGNVTDPKIGAFFQKMSESLNEIGGEMLFFGLELNRLDETELQSKLSAPKLATYAPWLREVRKFRDHQLSDEVEKILHDKSVTGHAAWNRLYDDTLTDLKFQYRGKTLDDTELTPLMTDKDPDVRRDAYRAYVAALKGQERIFALITNTVAKDKEIEDKSRSYPHPVAARNLENAVEDKVVEALATAVKDSYPLAHRYYAWKAKQFGKDKLDWWDRNAPLPQDGDRKYTWAESTEIILSAYKNFDPALGAIGQKFFDKAWIDAQVRPGKQTGAFAHPTVPSAHPYLLINFHGRARDVMTVAHELGHGCHQVLAGKAQGQLKSDTPLTLAETASVFGEMLTFRELLKREADPVKRKMLIASKVEDMLNTVVRQISFHEFEKKVHGERKTGELTAERLGELWGDTMKESLGPSVKFDDEAKAGWAGIPHFVHTPFYVYAYAYGDCLVNALYQTYVDQPQGFQKKYMDLLSAGGSKRHGELLAPFGLDASDPNFWKKGLKMLEGFIAELEADPAAKNGKDTPPPNPTRLRAGQ